VRVCSTSRIYLGVKNYELSIELHVSDGVSRQEERGSNDKAEMILQYQGWQQVAAVAVLKRKEPSWQRHLPNSACVGCARLSSSQQ
jgi:hypothetical protein